MQNTKKKLTGLSAAFFMLFLLPLPAEASSETFIQGCTFSDSHMKVYTSLTDTEKGKFTSTLASVSLSDPQTSSSEGEPVTWYCLVDISGSITEPQLKQEIEVLQSITDSMSDGSQMLIATLGNDVQKSDYLTDKTEIEKYIGSIEVDPNEDTNLYKGIVESISELKTGSSVLERKCLVLLSDGQDDQKTGYTKDEASDAAENALFPVYSVAALPEEPSNKQSDYGEILGSFARVSTGGKNYTPVLEDMDAQQTGEDIVSQMEQAEILDYDLSLLSDDEKQQISDEKSTLRIIFDSSDGKEYEDSIDVYTEDIPDSIITSTVTPEPTDSPTPTPEPNPVIRIIKRIPVWGRFAIAGAALVVLILIICLIHKLRKGRKDPESETKDIHIDDSHITGIDDFGKTGSIDDFSNIGEGGKQVEIEKTPKVQPSGEYHIVFSAIKYKDIFYVFNIDSNKSYVIGRNDKADIILNMEDRKLSSTHCEIVLQNEVLYVKDMSTNGTSINGVHIAKNSYTRMENSGIMLMGSYQYRVQWKKNI